jgi:hypothetical protein
MLSVRAKLFASLAALSAVCSIVVAQSPNIGPTKNVLKRPLLSTRWPDSNSRIRYLRLEAPPALMKAVRTAASVSQSIPNAGSVVASEPFVMFANPYDTRSVRRPSLGFRQLDVGCLCFLHAAILHLKNYAAFGAPGFSSESLRA